MRRILFGVLSALLSLSIVACDDDDDDAPPAPTNTAAAATATPSPDAAITIDQPEDGATVTVPIAMSGTANVFEAVLFVDAVDDSGDVLCTRRLMATSGTGTPGDWAGVIAFPPPAAAAPVTLRGYSFSAADGSRINVVERQVTLSPDLPDIVVTTPACLDEVSGPTLTVEGMAQVFEAALTVEIRDEFGNTPLSQNVMAASGVELSPWSATFDISGLPAGFYDVVAYSSSAEDGSIINVFAVQISKAP